jgi:NAD(P)-dependent dehydrogenase (short-subunit alcohol dehydrogenase family)
VLAGLFQSGQSTQGWSENISQLLSDALRPDRRRPRLHARHAGAQPDDIGDVIAFLASDNARWVNGDTARVDGGSKL